MKNKTFLLPFELILLNVTLLNSLILWQDNNHYFAQSCGFNDTTYKYEETLGK